MIVCSCRRITDADVREMAAHGATTPVDVELSCGAGADCGSCLHRIAEMLREERLSREAAETGTPALRASG